MTTGIDEVTHEHQRWQGELITVSYAGHPIMPSAVDRTCAVREFRTMKGSSLACGEGATHKLGEEGGSPVMHNLTAYVCCEHFRAVMGRCQP